MLKTLDQKLARIAADSACRDFILADAKDADMGFGISAPGPATLHSRPGRRFRSLIEFRDSIREIVRQGLVDIMLMSASTNELLTIEERLFDHSPVTPAARANDTTDIWCGQSGHYKHQPSLSFQSTTIDQIQSGRVNCASGDRQLGANLGLYSITFNNHAELDRESLGNYKAFRLEAESKGFRHFLEVFEPNALGDRAVSDVGSYVNDCIVRTLAGVTRASRPVFLKIPYFGPAAMEDLAAYDPSLVIGILGGSAGTTRDAFQLLHDAREHGARAALFGRKINLAEDQLSFVRYLRLLADGEIAPSEAVQAYHADLGKLGIPPARKLQQDLELTVKQ
ncbi:MAG: hypothetical protein ACK493_08000 [Planctomycetota bacterium]